MNEKLPVQFDPNEVMQSGVAESPMPLKGGNLGAQLDANAGGALPTFKEIRTDIAALRYDLRNNIDRNQVARRQAALRRQLAVGK
jgi:hypothetical protein